MDADRLRIDPFAIALGALVLLALAFFAATNGAAVLMSGLCIAGLVAGRIAGFSNRALVPAAAGLVAIVWMIWIAPPADTHTLSPFAHLAGGAVVGWAVAEHLRHRLSGRRWAFVTLAWVVALTILWELCEFASEEVLDTSLDPNLIDSAIDISCGILGATLALALAALLPKPAKPDRGGTIA